MISNTQGITSAAFAQMQRQQAERNAEQAEQRARALQADSRRARQEADRAQERARTLEVETDQATDEAGRARSGLAALRSLQTLDDRFGDLRTQISPTPTPSPTSAPAASPPQDPPVFNAQGQLTGTVINVTA